MIIAVRDLVRRPSSEIYPGLPTNVQAAIRRQAQIVHSRLEHDPQQSTAMRVHLVLQRAREAAAHPDHVAPTDRETMPRIYELLAQEYTNDPTILDRWGEEQAQHAYEMSAPGPRRVRPAKPIQPRQAESGTVVDGDRSR